jgi:hypothetical protein
MATVNKDFKIKSGLIVEGTTGTINGEDILTTSQASTDHIVSIVGGTTLVTSVAGNLNVTDGELTINETGLATDLAGTRLYSDGSTLNVDGEGLYDDFVANGMATTSDISTAISNAAGNYDAAGSASGVQSNLDDHISDTSTHGVTGDIVGTSDAQSISNKTFQGATYFQSAGGAGAQNNSINVDNALGTLRINSGYGVDLASDGTVNITSNANDIILNADGAAYITSATAGQQIATQSYVDNAVTNKTEINDAITAVGSTWSSNKIDQEIGNAVADVVGLAPEALNTLQELAQAFDNSPDTLTNLVTTVGGKQDALTAGNGIDITADTISAKFNTHAGAIGTDVVGNLEVLVDDTSIWTGGSANQLMVKTDSGSPVASKTYASDAASTAEQNAKNYTDNQLNSYTPTASLDFQIGAYGYAKTTDIPTSTDELSEGQNNLYFTNSRVEDAIIDPLTLGTQTNISVTYNTGTGAYDFVAENGVADSTTDDLDEGSTNLYFTNQRVLDAVDNAVITPNSIEINTFRKEEATQTYFNNASTATVHSFSYPYESVKYLVRVVATVGGVKHSQMTEILATIDGNNNVAVTEFGSIHTTEPALATFTVEYGSNVMLNATVANAGTEVIVAATLLSWVD